MTTETTRGKVWYAAYGSNLLERRFLCYLQGGLLPESGRVHTGARDPRLPEKSVPLWLPGTVYFAMQSTTWGGTGRGLYDPDTPGRSAGRGYLITAGQFLDVVAQEMRLEPGAFDGATALPSEPGERLRLGPGCYETLVCTQRLENHPVITMAAPWRASDIPLVALSGSYRKVIIAGLRETFGWHGDDSEQYLAGCPGGACPGQKI